MHPESQVLFYQIFRHTGKYRDMEKVNNQPEEPDNQDTDRFLPNDWTELRHGMLVKLDEELFLQYKVTVQDSKFICVLISALDQSYKSVRAEEYVVSFNDSGLTTQLAFGQVFVQVGGKLAALEEYNHVDEEETGQILGRYRMLVAAVIGDLAASLKNSFTETE